MNRNTELHFKNTPHIKVTQAGSKAWMNENGYIQQEQHLVTETEKIAQEVKENTPNES